MSPRRTRRDVVLPLLHALKMLSLENRVIVLVHLEDASRDLLYLTIN